MECSAPLEEYLGPLEKDLSDQTVGAFFVESGMSVNGVVIPPKE